tara:strand:- start:183 stop:599 length:417 start_codon:yes stop_codon:yes gene_type:complete
MVRNTGRTLTVNMTVLASLAKPITRQCTIQLDPNMTAQSEVFVPTTENWVITDCYILAAFGATGTTNPQIEFIKDRGVSMGITTPLSALLISNNTRPRFLPTPIGYEAGSILTIQGITTVDNNVTADDINFYVAVDIT